MVQFLKVPANGYGERKMRYSRLNKAGLIKKLREPTPPREPNRRELRERTRELKIRRYSKLNKAELIEQLENPSPQEYTRAQLEQMARERERERDTRIL